jgi:hypothetical protein
MDKRRTNSQWDGHVSCAPTKAVRQNDGTRFFAGRKVDSKEYDNGRSAEVLLAPAGAFRHGDLDDSRLQSLHWVASTSSVR